MSRMSHVIEQVNDLEEFTGMDEVDSRLLLSQAKGSIVSDNLSFPVSMLRK